MPRQSRRECNKFPDAHIHPAQGVVLDDGRILFLVGRVISRAGDKDLEQPPRDADERRKAHS